jgi:hypothetical protein
MARSDKPRPPPPEAEVAAVAAARASKYKPEYCALVVEEMAKGLSLGAFAGVVKVSRDTVVEWQHQHPEFHDAVSVGKAQRQLMWEKAGIQAAFTQKGGNVTMIQFALCNMGGPDWVNKQQIEHSGKDGAPPIKIESLTDAQLEHLIARLAK